MNLNKFKISKVIENQPGLNSKRKSKAKEAHPGISNKTNRLRVSEEVPEINTKEKRNNNQYNNSTPTNP
jgi:hypothetical protein